MGDAESLKEKGNRHFQKGETADAIDAYTTALDRLRNSKDPADALLEPTVLSNRAACQLKLSTRASLAFCVEDCTEALTILQHDTASSKNKSSSSSGSGSNSGSNSSSAIEKLRSKLLYRRAKANFGLSHSPDGTAHTTLNDAAKDILELLSFDKTNTQATQLLQLIRTKHGMHAMDSTPLSQALKGLTTEETHPSLEAKLDHLKIVYALLTNDVGSMSMELGKRGGVDTLLRVAMEHPPRSSRNENIDADIADKEMRTSTKIKTLAIQSLSCACSHPPFARQYATPSDLDQRVLASLVTERLDTEPDVAVAVIALMLRLVINLDYDHFSESTDATVTYNSNIDAPSLCHMCVASIDWKPSSPSLAKDLRPTRAALDLIAAWTSSDRDGVENAADAADVHSDYYGKGGKHRRHPMPSEDDLRTMKPRELAMHQKRQYEIKKRNQSRAKKNATLFCDKETGGLSALLSRAVHTKDHILRREIGVITGRLMSSIDDDIDIKMVAAPELGCTNVGEESEEKEDGLTIEEIFDEDEREASDLPKHAAHNEEEDELTRAMRRGQLTSSLLLGKAEVGTWALSKGWSDGEGITELVQLIMSKNDHAMCIASEVVSAAASTEKARPLILPLLESGALEILMENSDKEVRSGAASAIAKLGLADKALSNNEGEIIGLLQVAVELLEDSADSGGADTKALMEKASKAPKESASSSPATTAAERGIEVLSYLLTKTQIKEEIAFGFKASAKSKHTALERLVELASAPKSGESVISYGLATIFALMAVSTETLRKEAFIGKEITADQYEQLQALGKTEEEKENANQNQDIDLPEAVHERIRKMANCNVPRAMVKLMTNASEHTLEQVVTGMNRMAVEETARGIMVQQGCLSACLKVERGESPSETGKKILNLSRHSVAKLLVSMNPSLLTVSQRMGCVRPLIQLIRDNESTDLAQFEALLAITNLGSMDEETKNRIVAERGISVLGYGMFSDHEMVRRAATEAMSNLVPNVEMMKYLADPEHLKLWVAFASEFDTNYECARAAAGCLAMATQAPAVATALVQQAHFEEMGRSVLECGKLELMHRIMVILLNLLDQGGDCKDGVIACGFAAFCEAYVISYHDGTKAGELELTESEQGLMSVTVNLAKEIVSLSR